MSAGLPPPRRIIAHGFWLMGGAKMSKSLGNVARYQDYTAGLRAGRAALLRDARDAARPGRELLGRRRCSTRFNADLANDLGNLVSRAITMVHRYRDGRVPASPVRRPRAAGPRSRWPQRRRRSNRSRQTSARSGESGAAGHVESHRPREQVHRRARAVGAREGRRATTRLLDRTLYHAADTLRVIAALVDPVMPDAAARIGGCSASPARAVDVARRRARSRRHPARRGRTAVPAHRKNR